MERLRNLFGRGGAGRGEHQLSLHVYQYAHVYNDTTGVTELAVGPVNRPLRRDETIAVPPTAFHVVPPMHYARILNPHERALDPATGVEAPVRGRDGQVKCRMGFSELRYVRAGGLAAVLPPFPLYPDEVLTSFSEIEVVPPGEAIVIRVTADYECEARGDDVGGDAVGSDHPPTSTATTTTAVLKRKLGERYMVTGPATYYPRLEEEVADRRRPVTVRPEAALHCRALETFTTTGGDGGADVTIPGGSEYLRVALGEYLPALAEAVTLVPALALSRDDGVHVEVSRDYMDPRPIAKGRERKAGEVFTVTSDDCRFFPLHPYDVKLEEIRRTLVTAEQYCVVATVPRQGQRGAAATKQPPARVRPKRKGSAAAPTTGGSVNYLNRRVLTNTAFFLAYDEVLVVPPRDVHILSADQAVLLEALEDFLDDLAAEAPVPRLRGDRWLVCGPHRFIPSRHVSIVRDPLTGRDSREKVLLTDGQGVYVRHTTTGVVRLISGPASYMLEAGEELWEKPLPAEVRSRLNARPISVGRVVRKFNRGRELKRGGGRNNEEEGGGGRDSEAEKRKRVYGVVFHIPDRGVTQLFNYRTQKTRTLFGPDRVLLEPDEDFTVVSLSGSPWVAEEPNRCFPKVPGCIMALYLFLGPSNMSDVVQVETSDHARLSLQLCYDWYFDIPNGDAAAANKCFVVNDFVGNTCSFIASRVRSAVASLPFEQFHERSAQVLRESVFGFEPPAPATDGATATAAAPRPAKELRFPANNLVVTSVDIQEMQVLDGSTLRGLHKSVKTAIEIATHTQEVRAQQTATARRQASQGLLDRQRMADRVANEEQRRVLLETQREVLGIVSSSKSTAIAEALSQAASIESSAAVEAAKIRTEREVLVNGVLAEAQRRKKAALRDHEASIARESGEFHKAVEAVRHDLIDKVVAAIGPDTIAEMAKAGPELQAALLKSMGLEGYLVTDGSTPINLFQTASALSGVGGSAAATTSFA